MIILIQIELKGHHAVSVLADRQRYRLQDISRIAAVAGPRLVGIGIGDKQSRVVLRI